MASRLLGVDRAEDLRGLQHRDTSSVLGQLLVLLDGRHSVHYADARHLGRRTAIASWREGLDGSIVPLPGEDAASAVARRQREVETRSVLATAGELARTERDRPDLLADGFVRGQHDAARLIETYRALTAEYGAGSAALNAFSLAVDQIEGVEIGQIATIATEHPRFNQADAAGTPTGHSEQVL